MNRNAFLLALTFVQACGSSDHPSINVNPAFAPYYDTWNDEIRLNNAYDVPISFRSPSVSGRIGECSSENSGIRIDADAWSQLDDKTRELLIWHELGHCLVGRDHDTKWISHEGQRIPRSIMYPHLRSIPHAWRGYYIRELRRELRPDDIDAELP